MARITHHLDAVGLGPGTVFFTVTAPGHVEPERMGEWNATAPARFAAALRVLRQRMPRLEYARVLEMQRRGLLHLHAAMTGWVRADLEWVRGVLISHGFGPRFHVERVRDQRAIAGYVAARYLAKSHEDLGRRFRVVQYSRGWQGFGAEALDRETWRRALNVVDPGVVVPDGMSWSAWADREIAAGRGSYVVKPRSTGWPSVPLPLFDG